MTTKPSTPEQNAAYRAGLCIDCRTVRYSAGRPRCAECHAVRFTPNPPDFDRAWAAFFDGGVQ